MWWKKGLYLMLVFCVLDLPAAATAGAADKSDYDRGKAYFQQREYDKAVELLNTALKWPGLTTEEKIDVHYCLAYSYAAKGNQEEAVNHFAMILYLQPRYEPARLEDLPPKVAGALIEAKKKAGIKDDPKRELKKTLHTTAWALTGVAIAGVVAGGTGLGLSAMEYDNFQNAKTISDADAARDRGKTYQAISQAGFGIGIVSGAAAVGLFIYSRENRGAALHEKFDLRYARAGEWDSVSICIKW